MRRAWIFVLAGTAIAAIIAGSVILGQRTRPSYDISDGQFATYTVLSCGNAFSTRHGAGYELIGPPDLGMPVYGAGAEPSKAEACANARRPKQILGATLAGVGLILLIALVANPLTRGALRPIQSKHA